MNADSSDGTRTVRCGRTPVPVSTPREREQSPPPNELCSQHRSCTPAAARRQSAVVVEARRLLGALYADHGRPRRFTVAPQFRRLEPACSCWWHHHGRNRITLACVKTRSLLEPSVHVDFRNSRECESNDALHTLYEQTIRMAIELAKTKNCGKNSSIIIDPISNSDS